MEDIEATLESVDSQENSSVLVDEQKRDSANEIRKKYLMKLQQNNVWLSPI